MNRLILWSLCILCIVCPVIAEASQFVSTEADKLETLSDVIVVGAVNKVERDTENTIPKDITDYDIVTVTVAFTLKGTVTTKEIKVRLATRGNRAFDPTLAEGDTATFFLGKAKDGIHSLAYRGSVALFPKGYFTGSKE